MGEQLPYNPRGSGNRSSMLSLIGKYLPTRPRSRSKSPLPPPAYTAYAQPTNQTQAAPWSTNEPAVFEDRMYGSSEDERCEYCRKIDLDIFFSQGTIAQNHVAPAGSEQFICGRLNPLVLTNTSCRVCTFFKGYIRLPYRAEAVIAPDDIVVWSMVQYSVAESLAPYCSFPSSVTLPTISRFSLRVHRFRPDQFQERMLEEIRKNSHYDNAIGHELIWAQRMADNFTPDAVLRPTQMTADFDTAKHWLEHCSRFHPACTPSRRPVEGFKVIDCVNRTVVLATHGEKYTALSYVWGDSHTMTHGQYAHAPRKAENALPPDISPVIENSIFATQKLGLRYLWVDQLCINQFDQVEVQHQVERMNLIYGGAEITLVAAEGHNQWYGLPGVRYRGATPTFDLGGVRFFTIDFAPMDTIPRSVWHQRGWTFQEAMLSKRCLVFNRDMMYFECRCMFCSECVKINNTERFTYETSNDLSHGSRMIRRNGALFTASRASKTNPWTKFWDDIRAFSIRELTKSEDRLKAFAGIARRYAIDDGLYSMMGLPFNNLNSLVGCLQWESVPSSRVPQFPSFTWAGWSGRNRLPGRNGGVQDRALLVNKIRLPDWRYLSSAPITVEGNPYHEGVYQLILDAFLLPVEMISSHLYQRSDDSRNLYHGLPLWICCLDRTGLESTIEQSITSAHVRLLLLDWDSAGWIKHDKTVGTFTCLLIDRQSGGEYERVGMAEFMVKLRSEVDVTTFLSKMEEVKGLALR